MKGIPISESRKKASRAARIGRLHGEALIVVDGSQLLVVSANLGDNGKGANVHRGIGCGVEAGSGDAILREGSESHQQIACVGDAGVGKHALDVALHERAEVADGHGERGEHPQEDSPAMLHEREAGEGDAKQDGEGCGLGCGGHEADNGSGRALVDVRRPHMERCC